MQKIKVEKKIEKPLVSIVLYVIGGLLFIGGIVTGLVLGTVEKISWGTSYGYEFHFEIAIIYWVFGIVLGTLFIGYGEIIDLLTIIANRDYRILCKEEYEREEKAQKEE